jgi:Fe-S-cluster containining protein
VWFNRSEGVDIARAVGVDTKNFYKRYARRVDGRWSLSEHETPHGLDCVFLDRESQPGKAICSIYEARPVQCRTWPFWPENVRSRRTWERVKRNTPCPGMDTGSLVPLAQIRIQRDANVEGGKTKHQKPSAPRNRTAVDRKYP